MEKKFAALCRMTQKEMKEHVAEALKETHDNIIIDDGFVYAQGTFPVLLIAHMDTVHENLPDKIFYSKEDTVMSSPNGIGGDDRCGIYMILEVIKRFNCSVLFTEDEEIGCVGARKFAQTKLASELNFNYIIEFDRRGDKDAVFYECENQDFEDFITKEFFVTNYGSCSDISVIAPVLGCAAVNLSCGYYNEHTKKEYVVLSEMQTVIDEACKLLERTTEDDVYEYIEAEYDWPEYRYSGGAYKANEFERYYVIEYMAANGNSEYYDAMAVSEEEAIGMFCIDNPTISFCNVIQVWNEDML